jgi:hypothetical protein
MRRIVLLATLAFSLASFASGDALAKQCRDPHGKFMKCPPVVAHHCRDAHGKFAKCGTPGAH